MTLALFALAAALCALSLAAWWRPWAWRRARAVDESQGAPAGPRPRVFSLSLLALGLLAVAAAWVVRERARPDDVTAATQGAEPSQQAAKDTVVRLTQQLQRDPRDVASWQAIGRAYVTLKRYDDAAAAYAQASSLRPQDATLLADQAYALAMAHRRNLQGEPLALLDRARAIDPLNPKALALSGTAAFDRHDYSQALEYWELLARTQPPGSIFAQRVQPSIAEARRLGGVSRGAGPSVAASAMR